MYVSTREREGYQEVFHGLFVLQILPARLVHQSRFTKCKATCKATLEVEMYVGFYLGSEQYRPS